MAQPFRKWLLRIVGGLCVTAFFVSVLSFFLSQASEERRKLQDQSCSSNLKQLGLALIEYEQDSDNTLPSGVNLAGNGWACQLYPYIQTTAVYECPQDSHEGRYISYAENRNIAKQNYTTLTAPAGTVELYEFTTLNCDPSKPEAVSATGLNAPQDSTRHSRPQDPFGLNFGFADGHVKYLTPGQVSGGSNAVPPTHKGKYLATFAVR